MIRVLQVIEGLNAGGMESMLMNYYRKFDKNKIQFDFLVYSPRAHFDDEVELNGGKIYRITPRRKNPFKNYYELNSFFKKHKEYQIVQIHQGVTYFAPLVFAKLNHVKHIIAHTHGMNPSWIKKQGPFFRWFTQPMIEYHANHFIACSTQAAEQIFTKRVNTQNNYKLMRNAIEVKRFTFNELKRSKMRKELGLDGKFVVGHVGNFTYPKNHSFIIEVFVNVLKRNNNSVLVLVGDGIDRNKIYKKVCEYGLNDNVLFLGNRKDVHDVLQTFDVFLFPSHYEGLPVSLIEAQASGLKCVVSDTITKEVKITELVKYMSLNDSPENWAKNILDNTSFREDHIEEITLAGYNIDVEVLKMVNYYMNFRN